MTVCECFRANAATPFIRLFRLHYNVIDIRQARLRYVIVEVKVVEGGRLIERIERIHHIHSIVELQSIRCVQVDIVEFIALISGMFCIVGLKFDAIAVFVDM